MHHFENPAENPKNIHLCVLMQFQCGPLQNSDVANLTVVRTECAFLLWECGKGSVNKTGLTQLSGRLADSLFHLLWHEGGQSRKLFPSHLDFGHPSLQDAEKCLFFTNDPFWCSVGTAPRGLRRVNVYTYYCFVSDTEFFHAFYRGLRDFYASCENWW